MALVAALVAEVFAAVASAFASVANVGNALRKASARVEKFAASARDGGVGKAVIGLGMLRL